MAEQYIIQKESLVAIADAIRAKKESTALFSPEQMAKEIESLAMGNDLPNAEDSSFGGDGGTEYGILTDVTPTTSRSAYRSIGYKFTVKEAIAFYGFRLCGRSGQSNVMCLWDAETETEIVTLTKTTEQANTWVDYLLPTPINLEVGKVYMVSNFASYHNSTTESLTYNGKITSVKWLYANNAAVNSFPDTSVNYKNGIDIIIGDQITESVVTEYKIQVETLNDIADEIRRISGAIGSISPAQMLTLLKAVNV